MSNDQIKSLVTPRLFERVGWKVINKRNMLGEAYNAKKTHPITVEAIEEIGRTFKDLRKTDQIRVEQFVSSVEDSFVYKTIEMIIEKTIESNNEQTFVDNMHKVSNIIISHFKF